MLQRLRSELDEANNGLAITARLIGNDVKKWRVALSGPQGTVYEKGKFQIDFVFGEDYPRVPPKVSVKYQ